jgi:hypothetical protein
MIAITPPAVMPYAPSTQPIAFVCPTLMRDEVNANRLVLQFWFLDAKKNRINIDPNGAPSPNISVEQLQAFAAAPAQAGDTFDVDLERRCLPIIQANFGLSGTVGAVAAKPKATK